VLTCIKNSNLKPNTLIFVTMYTYNAPHGGTVATDSCDDHQAEDEVVEDGDEHVHGSPALTLLS
jgi:hypothetical protein